MAMDGFTKDMNIIQQLNDEPNDRDGLTAGELKAKFDEGGLALKDYLNNTVKPYVEGMEGTEAAHEADTVRHITAAERTAWNGKYDKTGGVLSGNVTVQPSGAPSLTLSAPEKSGTGRSKTVLQKNAGASADYGTQLIDYTWGDGTTANQRTILRVLSATVLADRLMLIDYAAGGDYVMYHLYGEHNLPAVANITGLQAALNGKVDKVTGKGLSTNDFTTAEKNKLAGIAAGAQVNSITGVKGNAESGYRTGNVNLTPANIGAAAASHTHDYLPLAGGTLTGDLMIQLDTGIPAFSLRASEKEGVGRARMMLYKEAGSTDYGTWLIDYTWDNSLKTALVLRNAAVALRDRLTLRNYTGSTSTTYHLFGEHNPPAVADVDGLQTALNGKSNTGHTHDYLPLSGGTLTGSLTIDPMGNSSPVLSLVNAEKSGVGPSRVNLYKNANASVDYGTQLADYTWGDGGTATNRNARLVLRSASTSLPDMLTLNVNAGTGGSTTVYKLYGEHNKPYVTAGQKSGTTLGNLATAEGHDTTASGGSSHAEGEDTIASASQAHAEGFGSSASDMQAHAEGFCSIASGLAAHAEGYSTEASGNYGAHAEGKETTASGNYSHAEGSQTVASVDASHAEGVYSEASGTLGAHAEGYSAKATGAGGAHAEGSSTKASGDNGAHAEGYVTEASGDNGAHAEGNHTIAAGNAQHVSGMYNVSDTTSAEIIGWGTVSTRKNIRTLATNGNEWIAGTLTQASDARLKDIQGEVPDVSGIRAVRFKWNDTNGEHDEKDHIGYIAQEVEAVAPYLVGEDSNGYKSLDYIALLCAKVETLERQVRELTEKLEGGD